MKTKVIVVLGPTAVGKTALGIELAQAFQGEIISGDSQQVYRQLDIGTAKASKREQQQAKHHLIDVRNIDENYSAYDFVVEATQAIEEIHHRGKVPIIVGGTGLYLQSLLEGYHLGGEVNQEAVLAYRLELEGLSKEALEAAVRQAGVVSSENNRRRLIRILELAKFGQDMTNSVPKYDALFIGLSDERELLYDRINKRVDHMLVQGLLEEARFLYDHHSQVQASRAIGYKEFFPYFAGEISLDDAVCRVKQQTRRFAKRQLTWFRNRMHINFYSISEPNWRDRIWQQVEAFLND